MSEPLQWAAALTGGVLVVGLAALALMPALFYACSMAGRIGRLRGELEFMRRVGAAPCDCPACRAQKEGGRDE